MHVKLNPLEQNMTFKTTIEETHKKELDEVALKTKH